MNVDAKELDLKGLNAERVHNYLDQPEAIKLLAKWVTLPDMHLVGELKEVVDTLNEIAPLPDTTRLYRGFYPNSAYQDTMGLSKRDWLGSKVKPHVPGEVYEYTLDRPLSFTTDLDIALAYGSTVVELVTQPFRFIWITDELNLLLGMELRKEAKSEKEVIVLPPFKASFAIVKA